MSRRMSVSEGAIQTHKCCLCGHFLSVAPIVTTGLETELYRCGRCARVKCQTYIRVRLFEDVAQHLSFPCTFAQCDKKIPWGRVEMHEKDCRHRTMKCPIYYHNCNDVVPVEQLQDHFRDKHSKNMKDIGSPWRLEINLDYVFLIEKDGELFLVYVLHLDEIFSVAVLALQNSKYTSFDLTLMPVTRGKYEVSFRKLPVVRYDERSHCYMCVRKKCNQPHHPFSRKHGNETIDVSHFTSKLESGLINSVKNPDGSLSYSVTLVAEETESEPRAQSADNEIEEEEGARALAVPPQMNVDVLRRNLTCPYCMTYMAAPIYMCSTGHTICNVCRPRLNQCPMCADFLGNARNYTLEDIAKDVGVPCQYDTKGCTFIGTSSKMYVHEMECSFSNILRE